MTIKYQPTVSFNQFKGKGKKVDKLRRSTARVGNWIMMIQDVIDGMVIVSGYNKSENGVFSVQMTADEDFEIRNTSHKNSAKTLIKIVRVSGKQVRVQFTAPVSIEVDRLSRKQYDDNGELHDKFTDDDIKHMCKGF